ncbi:MAG: glycosyltransferase family 2 protein [Sphingomicrobium sp.]
MVITQAPAVSMLIPVYGGEKLIGRTLDSLLAQSFTDFEALCVDDHSPDRSAAIVKERAAGDPRIRYLRTPANQGIVPKVINSMRHEVRGRYFVYSSQDDFFSTDWLEKMVAAMEQRDADAVVPNLEFVESDGSTIRKLSGWDLYGDKVISGREALLLSLDWTIPGNALWKTELLQQHGYFDFGLYADEFTARYFFLKCRRVAFCDSTFYYSQGNPGAITTKVSAGRLDYPYNQFKVWELIHEHLPQSEQGPKFARTVVRDLFEALMMVAMHPEFENERRRLEQAIQAMKAPEFRNDLRRAFSAREKARRFAAFALLDSAILRAVAPACVLPARRAQRLLQSRSGEPGGNGPISSSR